MHILYLLCRLVLSCPVSWGEVAGGFSHFVCVVTIETAAVRSDGAQLRLLWRQGRLVVGGWLLDVACCLLPAGC